MAIDLSKLSFYSGSRYERVALKDSATFSTAGFVTVAISHNLGYKPYYKAWYTYGDGKYFQLYAGTGSFDIDGNGSQVDNVNVDTVNLNVSFFAGSPISGAIYYRIYAEPQP